MPVPHDITALSRTLYPEYATYKHMLVGLASGVIKPIHEYATAAAFYAEAFGILDLTPFPHEADYRLRNPATEVRKATVYTFASNFRGEMLTPATVALGAWMTPAVDPNTSFLHPFKWTTGTTANGLVRVQHHPRRDPCRVFEGVFISKYHRDTFQAN
jgi:hypothetical protein